MKYTAKSASDKTDDFPRWMIVDENGLNVTVNFAPSLRGHLPFLPRWLAEGIAEKANEDPSFIYKPRVRVQAWTRPISLAS